jgi:hypothetical protein
MEDSLQTSVDIDSCVRVGSIVSSNSHLDYVVEIFKDHDCDRPPALHEREFGQPVFVRKTVDGTEYGVIGVIYDTQLVDPDQGRTGPRLAQDDQAQFTPSYIEEQTTLAGVALLGTVEIGEDCSILNPTHQMPRWSLEIEDTVFHSPEALTAIFHTNDGHVPLGYTDRLMSVAGEFGSEVIIAVIDRLRQSLQGDETHRILDVVEQNIQWQTQERRGVV